MQSSGRWRRSVPALAGVGVLLLHASSYLPFIADDALISLRYARRLLDGQGLTWTAGEVVEGYSNLLWILLCALLGATGIDLIVAARILGVVGSAAAVAALVHACPPADRAGMLPPLAAAVAFALTGPIAVWTVGGLEQPLLAALLGWALALLLRELDGTPVGGVRALLGGAAVPLALLCWTRPDGALFTAAAVVGILAARGWKLETLRRAAALTMLPLLAYLAQLGFRLFYYGDWLPNPAYAKLGLSPVRAGMGLRYVGEGLGWMAALALPAAALALIHLRDRGPAGRKVRLLVVPLVFWAVYVVLIGGDLFPARRHLVPLVLLLCLLLAVGLNALLLRRSGKHRALRAAALGLLVLLGAMQQFDPDHERARLERWEWDGQVVGNLLREAFGEQQPLMAVDPGGTLPYFSGLPSLDMLGINDRFLARHPPADRREEWLGHDLGDGKYVLDRQPDLIVFCGPGGSPRPCFRSGQELFRDPRFRESYRLVQFEGEDPYRFSSRIWLRAEGGPIGIQRRPDRVLLPGYLLSANPKSVVRLDRNSRPAVEIGPGVPAGVVGLPLPAGRWRTQIEPAAGTLRVEIRRSGSTELLAAGAPGRPFELAGDAPLIDVIVSAVGAEPYQLRELVLLLDRP